MAGLDANGFTIKTLAQIQSDVKARFRTYFGSGVDTNEDSAIMNFANPLLLELQELWEGTQIDYQFLNPNSAEGIALDNIGLITNTPRVAGTNSTIVVQATGNAGATIPVGFQRGVQDTNELFELTAEVGLQTLPVVGSQPLEFVMTALNDGPVAAVAGTLNQGALPSGITTLVNAVDADLGTEDETDEEYRIGRKQRLAAIGAATVGAIKASILSVDGVTSAAVLENDTDVTDVNGITPHAILCLVTGGLDQDIVDAIGSKKGAGTGTVGTSSGTYTDPVDGQTFTINFSRETEVPIYVDVVITSKNSEYPTDGDTQIRDNIVAYGVTLETGEDVFLPSLQNAVTSVPGIESYTLLFSKTDPPLTSTNIVIDFDERANFESTNIDVTS